MLLRGCQVCPALVPAICPAPVLNLCLCRLCEAADCTLAYTQRGHGVCRRPAAFLPPVAVDLQPQTCSGRERSHAASCAEHGLLRRRVAALPDARAVVSCRAQRGPQPSPGRRRGGVPGQLQLLHCRHARAGEVAHAPHSVQHPGQARRVGLCWGLRHAAGGAPAFTHATLQGRSACLSSRVLALCCARLLAGHRLSYYKERVPKHLQG